MTRKIPGLDRDLFPWTDTQVATLTRLWMVEGKSSREIAAFLGQDLTRSAVCGKVHRLGLKRAMQASNADRTATIRRQATQRRKELQAQPRVPLKPPAPLPEPKRAPVLIDVSNFRTVTILTMGRDDCKFDMGGEGADALFCGESRKWGREGESHLFCRHHTKVGVLRVKDALKQLPTAGPNDIPRPASFSRGTKLIGLGIKMWAVA